MQRNRPGVRVSPDKLPFPLGRLERGSLSGLVTNVTNMRIQPLTDAMFDAAADRLQRFSLRSDAAKATSQPPVLELPDSVRLVDVSSDADLRACMQQLSDAE